MALSKIFLRRPHGKQQVIHAQNYRNTAAALRARPHWYNHEHRHSAIRFVTPAERHAGLDGALLDKRIALYAAAKERHPERWSGATRNWQPVSVVYLNPDQHIVKKSGGKEGCLA